MEKHAYLIMAHKDVDLINKLLECIDDPRNSVYIHLDSKATFGYDNLYIFKHATCYYMRRRKVMWAGYSQIQIELELLQIASKENYEYYHLLSGQDLPIV